MSTAVSDPNPLMVAIPTHDSRTVVYTMIALTQLGNLVPGGIHIITAEGGNIPRTRNLCMDIIRHNDPKPADPCWVLWIDSDILVAPEMAPVIAEYINEAMVSHRPWLVNYNMADGRSTLMKDRTQYNARHYSTEELIALPDWAEVGMGGFGMAFLPMELGYQFKADISGEDIHYFLDHPDLTVHVAKKIILRHRKAVWV